MAEVVGAFFGAFFGGLAAFAVARWQRGKDLEASRQAAATAAVGQLAAAIAELRWEAAHLASVPISERSDASRRLAPLRGRMVAAHTAIYSVSTEEALIQKSRAVVQVGLDLLDAGASEPFDPATYETLRSVLERTFRDLRQRARLVAGLALLEGEPTSETTGDDGPGADPVLW